MAQETGRRATFAERFMRPWVWKTAVVVYGIYIFALIAFYMAIAGRSVTYSYTIAGQSAVSSGQPSALRLGVFDIHKGRFLPRADVRVDFVRGQNAEPVYMGKTSAVGLGDVNLDVPNTAPGPGAWRITLEPQGLDPEVVEIPIEVNAAAAPDKLQPWTEATVEVQRLDAGGRPLPKPEDGTGPIRIEMMAEGHTAVDGLRSLIFIQTTDRATGAPIAADVQIIKKKGMIEGPLPKTIATNKGGLAAFPMVPIGNQEFEVKVVQKGAEGQPEVISKRKITLLSEPTQTAMTLRDPIWAPGESLEVSVQSLHRSGEVYGDLYMGDRWLRGEVTGVGKRGAGFGIEFKSLPRPEEGVWLVRFQVYRDALDPGKAGDMRYIVVPAPGLDARGILTELVTRARDADLDATRARALLASEWLKTAPSRELQAQIAWWLSLLDRDIRAPKLLKDTQQGERDALDEEKIKFRTSVTWLLVISGGLGLAIILYMVVMGFLRVRRESHAMMAELGAEDPEITANDFARTSAIFQLVLLFATIAVFFAAIVVLLQVL